MSNHATKRFIKSILCLSVSTLALTSCSFQGPTAKPLMFRNDCRKIEAKVLESAAVWQSIYEESIPGEVAKSKLNRIISYFRSYSKVRASNITKDQKLFIAELIEDNKYMVDWVDIWVIDPFNYPTSTQWYAMTLMIDELNRRALVPCSTLTYKEFQNLPVNQPIP